MTDYVVRHGDDRFLMSFVGADATAAISANFHDPNSDQDWQLTPYQTSDVSGAYEAARLVVDYFAEFGEETSTPITVERVES